MVVLLRTVFVVLLFLLLLGGEVVLAISKSQLYFKYVLYIDPIFFSVIFLLFFFPLIWNLTMSFLFFHCSIHHLKPLDKKLRFCFFFVMFLFNTF